jgi:hypothetical protein
MYTNRSNLFKVRIYESGNLNVKYNIDKLNEYFPFIKNIKVNQLPALKYVDADVPENTMVYFTQELRNDNYFVAVY